MYDLLDVWGVRSLELDCFYDPDGGFTNTSTLISELRCLLKQVIIPNRLEGKLPEVERLSPPKTSIGLGAPDDATHFRPCLH